MKSIFVDKMIGLWHYHLKNMTKHVAFCPEITTKISNKKYKIVEIPISYNGRTYQEGKKISSIDGLEALYCLIKYKYFSKW